MRVFAEPAVTSHFKEVSTLSRIRDEDPPQEIARVRRNIFGEGQRRGNNVFVQQVDVITLWVRRIVVKRQIASKHGILEFALSQPISFVFFSIKV